MSQRARTRRRLIPLLSSTVRRRRWWGIVGWDHSWDAADHGATTYEGDGVDFDDLGTRFASIPDRGSHADLRDLELDGGAYGTLLSLPGPVPGPLRTVGPWFGGRVLALADDAKSINGGTSLFTSPNAVVGENFTEDTVPVWGSAIIVPNDAGIFGAFGWESAFTGASPQAVTLRIAGGVWVMSLGTGTDVTTAVAYVNDEPVLLTWQVAVGANASWLEVNGVRTTGTLSTANTATVIGVNWGFRGRGYRAVSGMKSGEPTAAELDNISCFYDGLVDGTDCGFFDDFETYADDIELPSPPYTDGLNPRHLSVEGQAVPPDYDIDTYGLADTVFGALSETAQTVRVSGTLIDAGGFLLTQTIVITTTLGYVSVFAGWGSSAAFLLTWDDGGGADDTSLDLSGVPIPADGRYELLLSYETVTHEMVAHLIVDGLTIAIQNPNTTPDLGDFDFITVSAIYASTKPAGVTDEWGIDCTALPYINDPGPP